MKNHKQFEIMCALAATGQIGEVELQELTRHLARCPGCRSRIADFAQIGAQALPLSGGKYGRRPAPKALTSRFVARARAEGISLQPPRQILPSNVCSGPLGWTGNFAAALLTIAIVVTGIFESTHSRPSWLGPARAEFVAPIRPNVQEKENPILTSQKRIVSLRASIARPRPSHRPANSSREQRTQSMLAGVLFLNRSSGQNTTLLVDHDRAGDESRLTAPFLTAFREFRRSKNPSLLAPGDLEERPVEISIASLAGAAPLFRDRPDTSLSSIFSGAPSHNFRPQVDWCRLLLANDPHPQQNSSDSSPCRSALFPAEWPSFSGDLKVDRQ